MHASPDYDVVVIDQRDEKLHFGRVKLSVAVTQQNVRLRSRANARDDRSTIAAVHGMMHDLDVGVFRSEPVSNFTRPIKAAVVDYDDLVIVGERRQRSMESTHDPLDITFFIVRREKDRQAWQAMRLHEPYDTFESFILPV